MLRLWREGKRQYQPACHGVIKCSADYGLRIAVAGPSLWKAGCGQWFRNPHSAFRIPQLDGNGGLRTMIPQPAFRVPQLSVSCPHQPASILRLLITDYRSLPTNPIVPLNFGASSSILKFTAYNDSIRSISS